MCQRSVKGQYVGRAAGGRPGCSQSLGPGRTRTCSDPRLLEKQTTGLGTAGEGPARSLLQSRQGWATVRKSPEGCPEASWIQVLRKEGDLLCGHHSVPTQVPFAAVQCCPATRPAAHSCTPARHLPQALGALPGSARELLPLPSRWDSCDILLPPEPPVDRAKAQESPAQGLLPRTQSRPGSGSSQVGSTCSSSRCRGLRLLASSASTMVDKMHVSGLFLRPGGGPRTLYFPCSFHELGLSRWMGAQEALEADCGVG